MKLDQVERYGIIRPLNQVRPPAPQPPSATGFRIEDVVPGEHLERDGGVCFVVSEEFGERYTHGLHLLHDLGRVSWQHLALITRDPEIAYLDLAHTVFLDTETTGLGMGAGTYVFLVGAGYVRAGRFQVRQFFLTGPDQEKPFLDELSDFLSRFSSIVSFNGKAFDWPLLENRFHFHRRRPPFDDPLHVDLLYPARRLWKRRLESCALSSLEARILRVQRTEEDVPGYLIPQLYFQYVSTRDGRPLQRVFYHNLHDVLSLATLTVHIERILADPGCGLVEDGVDYLSLGKAYDAAGRSDQAVLCYEEALLRQLEKRDREECLIKLGGIQKRERRWETALQVWQRLLDEGGWAALLGRLELAKYYEHVERDYLQAIDQVQHALDSVDLFGGAWPETDRHSLEHRLSRLVNRAIRARSWTRA